MQNYREAQECVRECCETLVRFAEHYAAPEDMEELRLLTSTLSECVDHIAVAVAELIIAIQKRNPSARDVVDILTEANIPEVLRDVLCAMREDVDQQKTEDWTRMEQAFDRKWKQLRPGRPAAMPRRLGEASNARTQHRI